MSVVAVPSEPFESWPNRPAHPADQAQARIFEDILRLELDDVEQFGSNARINEVRGLLHALRMRFG